MQYVQQKSPLLNMGQDETVKHLMHTISRSLIAMMGASLYIWAMLSTVAWTGKLIAANGCVAIVMIIIYAPVIRLLEKHPGLAQILWETGLAVAITLALYISKEPIVGFFYTLIPLISIVTLGWSACLVTEGLLIVWVCVLSATDVLLPLNSIYALGIIFTGAATGLMGWAITHTLLTVTAWSLHSYNESRIKIDEVREQRAELLQVQEDLLLANQELARMSDRMRALHQIAEEASQAKAEFVANVSHELRTPLNMIIGFSEVITEAPEIYGDLPSALIADIISIQRNSEHLAKLVNDVLDLSQVDAGRMALSRTWSSMTDILNDAVKVVRDLYESKGLYLTIDTSSDLPNVFCDTTRVRQVVINLLSNAGRFTERGGVTIKTWQEKHGVTISVTDTGPGIAEEDQAKLFEPFQQLDSSIRRRHGGSGLGLSISKRFVEMHGGKMWLESKRG
ncbi:MAG: HAMP domain-containing sensor histidine kinase, partial [Anaerolineae bacterium]|nr:HAMP domain-containing sensor histidine kinase [Anaerolineae bacterium]